MNTSIFALLVLACFLLMLSYASSNEVENNGCRKRKRTPESNSPNNEDMEV